MKNALVKICFILPLTLLLLQSCSERFSHSVQQVPPPPGTSTTAAVPDYSDSTIMVAAGEHYGRSWLHTFFYGKKYRNAWTTPVEVKVLDIGKAKGGLTPLQQGGSRQTVNLRLQDSTGREFVIRSVDKEPASSLPEKWQKSYLANIARDATAATHPYAALTLAPMADAIHMYHLAPELVFVPHDPRLGEHLQNFGGMVALLEKRPTGNQSNDPKLGNAKNVKSTRSMLEERIKDNDVKVNARQYLRARMFDMLIGDWSRHEDNWRWAEFKQDSTVTYKAVPRDRDNVFYLLNDAIIPWLFTRTNLKPHFQTYRANLKHVVKLNLSGHNLDKLILSELTWQDWQEVADSVQHELTDEVITRAFHKMPDTIYALTAAPIMAKLKNRRDHLQEFSATYYKHLAAEAVVVGTEKQEFFKIEILSARQVRVRVYKINKKGNLEQQLSDRTYDAETTDEIQLYGLDGDDQFTVTGEAKPKIKIYIWGGAGEDDYKVTTTNEKAAARITIEDSKYRNTYDVAKKTEIKVNDNPPANKFDGKGWLLRYYLN